MVADELVQESSAQAAEDRTYQIDGELAQVLAEFHVADEPFDQQRADLPRRIERCAGDRTDQDDDPVDDESNDDSSKARRGASINCGAKDGEDEDRRADGFSRDGD